MTAVSSGHVVADAATTAPDKTTLDPPYKTDTTKAQAWPAPEDGLTMPPSRPVGGAEEQGDEPHHPRGNGGTRKTTARPTLQDSGRPVTGSGV